MGKRIYLVSVFCIATLFSSLFFTGSNYGATVNLWDIFPKSQQGENGVNLVAYDMVNNQFRYLTYISDYSFGTPGNPWNIPYISRGNEPWIVTHPLGWELGGQEQTFLLCSSPYGPVYIDKIEGTVDPWDGGDVTFMIVGSNLSGPSQTLYQTHVQSSTVPFSIGPFSQTFQFLSFHVSPNGYSSNDTTYYQATITFRPVPIPSTFLLFLSSLATLPFLRKKISCN